MQVGEDELQYSVSNEEMVSGRVLVSGKDCQC